MTDNLGLYLHIPFCEKKCRYCDFYSSFLNKELLGNYAKALIREITEWGGSLNGCPIDTLYLGGGTPSLLEEDLPHIIRAAALAFSLCEDSEITLELNPSGDSERQLFYAKEAGVNRLSIGAQSGIDSELSLLGRTHTVKDTAETFALARRMGFSNISLDLMIGLPHSDNQSLTESLEFLTDLGPEHISAYILKLEENTAFWKMRESLSLPDDDSVAEQYLLMCDFLENRGLEHYEISNFARKGFESRHNLKYWSLAPYLGLGPSAHSFLKGKRFYYPRDIKEYIAAPRAVEDGVGGDEEEFIMLALRLKKGVSFSEYQNRFKKPLPHSFLEKCRLFEKAGLMLCDDSRAALTNRGMLLSNSIISDLLE